MQSSPSKALPKLPADHYRGGGRGSAGRIGDKLAGVVRIDPHFPTWYELALQQLDKRQAAQVMGCTPGTAEKRLQSAREQILRGTIIAAGRFGDPALEALALFLQSNFPVDDRHKCRLERAVLGV